MKLKDCDLNIDAVATARFIHDRPERSWLDDQDGGTIPKGLFRFYHQADWLSFDKAPRFLSDGDHVLFSYLGNLLQAVRGSIKEARRLSEKVRALNEKHYSPARGVSGAGVTFEFDAADRQTRAYKHFVIEVSAILDVFADVAAMLFPGEIPGLTLGRAQFPQLRAWIEQEVEPVEGQLVSPRRHQLERFHVALEPLIRCEGTDRDWHRLLQLHRNKLMHLGSPAFPAIVLTDDVKDVHVFLPRRWPYLPQKFIKAGSPVTEGVGEKAKSHIETHMIHEDLVDFCDGLFERVWATVDAGFDSLAEAYERFREFEFEPELLARLEEKEQVCGFESFG